MMMCVPVGECVDEEALVVDEGVTIVVTSLPSVVKDAVTVIE